MLLWLLCGFLLFTLISGTGRAAEEGSPADKAKEAPRAVEPKKKQETDTKSESNGKHGTDKQPSADDKTKAADEKAKDEKPKTEDNAKTEAPKPEEGVKKPVTSLNLAIKLALMADPQLFPLDIEVEMDKGKAILTGSAPTEEDKTKVTEIAGKIEGVEAVVNKLTVTPALKDKLAKKQDESIAHVVRDRLSRSETLKAVGFDVKSENGIVYLSGKTRFQVIALEAAEAARQVPGVRAVDTAGVQLVAKD
ncbi:MAG TPA: BON domain-containing protein [Nitrospira sp.]|nr:BON domain-containing protein [Nitrospira sp.]